MYVVHRTVCCVYQCVMLYLCIGVLQDEVQELDLPTEPMEKILVKLAELKQVNYLVLPYDSHMACRQYCVM